MTIEAQRQAVANERQAIERAAKPASPELALLAQVEDAAKYLTRIGTALGNVGREDESSCTVFAERLRKDVHVYVNQLIARKRKELSDLERFTLGRSGSNEEPDLYLASHIKSTSSP